jgi:hypothetical protein
MGMGLLNLLWRELGRAWCEHPNRTIETSLFGSCNSRKHTRPVLNQEVMDEVIRDFQRSKVCQRVHLHVIKLTDTRYPLTS